MAFINSNWSRQSVALNTGEVTASAVIYGAPCIFSYRSAADDVATIAGANYFADAVYDLSLDDLIYVVGTDAVGMYVVDALDRAAGTITVAAASLTGTVNTANIADLAVTTAKLAADAVTNAKLADDAVSLENLDAGITPSHVIRFAGQPTTVGGGAAEAITVTGAAATDLAFVQMVDDGTNNVTIVNAVVTTNTLTVTFSGDPGNDAVINYQIVNAAS